MADEPKILSPARGGIEEYFAETAALATLSTTELRDLLGSQIDSLNVLANSAALKVMKRLKEPDLPMKVRESLVKEMVGYGMFADMCNRQRTALGKSLIQAPGEDTSKPNVAIPKSLSNEEWEKKYSDKFMDKVGIGTKPV